MSVQTENKLKSLSIQLAFGGLLLMAAGLAYLFLTPKSYQATTRLKVTDWIHAKDANNPSDSSVAPAECQVVRSDAVMDTVIAHLDLEKTWGRRYGPGTALNPAQARAMLKSKALIQPDPKSSLIEIQVTSEEPDETAGIANEIARVYLDYRQTKRQELIRDNLGSLKQQWDDLNGKLQDALATQAKLYFDISKARSTNQLQVYDADAYDKLLGKQVELESDYKAGQSQLAELKKLDPDHLKQVLPTLDRKSLLGQTLTQLNMAKSDLAGIKVDHGPESSEVKHASLVVATINQRVDELVEATMTTKETELAGLKDTLDDLGQKIKHATTNLGATMIHDQEYNQVSEQIKNLQQERDDLQHKMYAAEATDKIRPTSVTTEIIDTAEIPAKPFTPNRKVAIIIMAAGGGVIIGGLLLLALSQRTKPRYRKLSAV